MVTEKRKGYKTQEQQNEANKRYYKNNPDAKEKRKIANAKSGCYKYIREYANLEELNIIKKLIDEKLKIIKNKG